MNPAGGLGVPKGSPATDQRGSASEQFPCLPRTGRTSLGIDPGDCRPQNRMKGPPVSAPSRFHGMHVRVFLTACTKKLSRRAEFVPGKEQKGHMRRQSKNQLWILLLMLSLLGTGMATAPRAVWADVMPGESPPPPPPEQGVGDPDDPGRGGAQRPGMNRGGGSSTRSVPQGVVTLRTNRTTAWVWTFRTAFSTVFRAFFRF